MALQVEIISDFREVGDRLMHAAAAAPAIIDERFAVASDAIRELVLPILADHTPRRTGQLADSTTADTTEGGREARIDFRQPATNDAGELYAQYVILGHGDIYPVQAQALHWTDGGQDFFAKHVGPVDPNPYPTEAMDAAGSDIDAALAAQGVDILAHIVTVLH